MKYSGKERFTLRQVVIMFTIVFVGITVISYGAVTIPYTFTPGTTISSDEVNQNFQAIKTAMEAPKYWTVNLFGMAKPAWNDFQGTKDGRGLLWESGSNQLTIPVYLPYGSTIQEFKAFVYDESDGQDIKVELKRTPINDGNAWESVAVVSSSGTDHMTPGYGISQTVDSYPVDQSISTFYIIITYGDYEEDTHDALGIHTILIKYLPEQLL